MAWLDLYHDILVEFTQRQAYSTWVSWELMPSPQVYITAANRPWRKRYPEKEKAYRDAKRADPRYRAKEAAYKKQRRAKRTQAKVG